MFILTNDFENNCHLKILKAEHTTQKENAFSVTSDLKGQNDFI